LAHDQLPDFFSALADYPLLRYDLGGWCKGYNFSKGANMRYNMEFIVYVWRTGSAPFNQANYDPTDQYRRVSPVLVSNQPFIKAT